MIKRILLSLGVATALLAALVWLVGYYVFAASDRAGAHSYAPVSEAQKTQARAYLAATGIPGLPADFRFSEFEAADGITLRTGLLDVKEERGTVLIIPGYTAPLDMMGRAVSAFAQAGYDVAGIEQRGQGLSHRALPNPEKGHQSDYSLLSDDVAAFLATLEARDAGPVFIHAISMGAHIALRMAGDNQPDVAAYSLVVPMVRIETGAFPYPVARGLTNFYTLTGLAGAYTPGGKDWAFEGLNWKVGDACNSNSKTARFRDALVTLDENLRVGSTTNGWVAATMASTDTITAPRFTSAITKPVLMVTAGKDSIVSTPAAQAMCNTLSNCEERHYAEARHCLMQESAEREAAILRDAIKFFEGNR